VVIFHLHRVKIPNCKRYRLEERGIVHPDNLLPNGETILEESGKHRRQGLDAHRG
jgi:hypothetical protein